MEKEILELLKHIQQDNKEFRNEVNTRFTEIDTRFTKLDTRFTEFDTRFTKLDTSFTDLNARFTEIEIKVDKLDKTLAIIHDQTANLTEFRTEVNAKLEDLKEVKEVTKENCYQIAKIKAVK